MREAPGHGAISMQHDLRFSLVSVVLTSGGSGRTTMNSNILSDYYCTLMNHSSLLRSLKIEVNHCIYCSKTKHALTQRLSKHFEMIRQTKKLFEQWQTSMLDDDFCE
jgi:hypothetical protein